MAIHTALLLSGAERNKFYEPSLRTKIIVTATCWIFPIVWWTVVGISMDAYETTGYFCWVRFRPEYISLMFGDIPLLLCCIVVTVCYTYVVFRLARIATDKKFRDKGGSSFRREIRRSVLYIVVYVIWIHPYLIVTLTVMAGKQISRGLWLYFLALINSMGWMNFFAYGISERWFTDVRAVLCCKKNNSYSSSMGNSTRNSNRKSQRRSIDVDEIDLPKVSEDESKKSQTEDKLEASVQSGEKLDSAEV